MCYTKQGKSKVNSLSLWKRLVTWFPAVTYLKYILRLLIWDFPHFLVVFNSNIMHLDFVKVLKYLKALITSGIWIGGFRITGRMCTQCPISDPIGGELTVEASAVPIQSIDIHLLRVESILIGEKIATESSVIQTTQAFFFFLVYLTLVIYMLLLNVLSLVR